MTTQNCQTTLSPASTFHSTNRPSNMHPSTGLRPQLCALALVSIVELERLAPDLGQSPAFGKQEASSALCVTALAWLSCRRGTSGRSCPPGAIRALRPGRHIPHRAAQRLSQCPHGASGGCHKQSQVWGLPVQQRHAAVRAHEGQGGLCSPSNGSIPTHFIPMGVIFTQ